MPIDAFTISSNNYLGMARVFADSYLEHHPGSRVFVCLVDRLDDRVPYEDLPFEIILAEDLDISEFQNFSFRYSILELNTAVKPFVFKYLRDTVGLERVFYFDPDILVHDHLEGLEEALASHQAVLTPHLTEPIDNSYRPPERVIGMCGVYNLGFVGLQLDEGTASFLDWWCDRLHRYCIVDLANGMFVDQSWMDFAPAYLDSVAVVRDPIFNIAYWNLPHRRPVQVDDHWEVDGRRVGFFHFSGVDLDDLDVISRHQERIDLWSRPELRPLFEGYRDLVEQSGQQEIRGIPYHFGTFAGTDIAIPWVSRIALQENDPRGLRWPDPFAVESDDSFLAWLAEPLEYHGQTVNRTALYLWQERPDVRKEFSDLEGEDLPRFLEWYYAKGHAEEGFHEVFMEALRTAPPKIHSVPFVAEIEEIARIDLGAPGERTAWLNQPIDEGGAPNLTRLSMAIHRVFPYVADQYPDPLGRDRNGFAYWFVLDGSAAYGLHPDLVAPVRSTLPARSRVSATLKRLLKPRTRTPRRLVPPVSMAGDPPLPKSDTLSRPSPEKSFLELTGRSMRTAPAVGVNLVGFFDGSEGAWSFAPAIREALDTSGVPHAEVELDRVLPDHMTSDRIRHHEGAPFPVTVLAIPLDRWSDAVRRMPVGCRVGSRVIGYCSEVVESSAVERTTMVDEVWAPTEAMARELSVVLPMPVRTVPPLLARPVEVDEESGSLGLDPNRFWFLARSFGSCEEDHRAVSSAIECVRSLRREGDERIGVCLAGGPTLLNLKRQVRHLPVVVVTDPIDEASLNRLLSECDGYLDLRRGFKLDPAQLEAMMRGLPVISGWTARSVNSWPAEDLTQIQPEYHVLDIEWATRAMRAAVEASGANRIDTEVVRDPAFRIADVENAAGTWGREVARLLEGRPSTMGE